MLLWPIHLLVGSPSRWRGDCIVLQTIYHEICAWSREKKQHIGFGMFKIDERKSVWDLTRYQRYTADFLCEDSLYEWSSIMKIFWLSLFIYIIGHSYVFRIYFQYFLQNFNSKNKKKYSFNFLSLYFLKVSKFLC